MINWDDTTRRFADLARPLCIVFLGGCIGIGLFTHADPTLMTIVSGVEGLFVGARSFENNAQIKANVATSTATAQVATPDKVTTLTRGVQPDVPVSVPAAPLAPIPAEPPHKMG